MKKAIKILLLADSWSTLALGMIGPIYAIFVQQIGGDLLDASWAYFAFMITSGIMIYLMGHWEDRIKHKEKILIASYALTSIGCLFYIFVFNQLSLILTQVILGLAAAMGGPAYDAIYSKYLNIKKAASEWGSYESMWYIVTAIAALTGGYIANTLGFKVLFFIMFLISLLSMATALYLLKNKEYLNS